MSRAGPGPDGRIGDRHDRPGPQKFVLKGGEHGRGSGKGGPRNPKALRFPPGRCATTEDTRFPSWQRTPEH